MNKLFLSKISATMRKLASRLAIYPLIVALALLAAGTLTGCVADGWYPVPPSGWTSWYDSGLTGKWRLVECNGQSVGAYDTNWMEFYGNGRGMYYYYSYNRPYSERIAYWCQQPASPNSPYQINVQYEDGSTATMNYWFQRSGTELCMQWRDHGTLVTYVYASVSYINW